MSKNGRKANKKAHIGLSPVNNDSIEDDMVDSNDPKFVEVYYENDIFTLGFYPAINANQLAASSASSSQGNHETKIVGRAPVTCISGGQGDHVTAHGMIVRGLGNAIDTFSVTGEDLPTNIRDVRKELYNLMTTICLFGNYDTHFPQISEILICYNNSRLHKTDINDYSRLSETIYKAADLQTVDPKEAQDFLTLHHKVLSYLISSNCQAIANLFSRIIEQILIIYNGLPNVAFEKIQRFEPVKGEGPRVNAACNYLSGVNNQSVHDDIKQRNFERISSALANMFFFPEVTEELACDLFGVTKLTAAKITKKKKEGYVAAVNRYGAQINNRGKFNKRLSEFLARHFILAEACFPVMKSLTAADKEAILRQFIEITIEKNWPSYASSGKTKKTLTTAKNEQNKIIQDVIKKIQDKYKLKKRFEDYLEEQDIQSSDDEGMVSNIKKNILNMWQFFQQKNNNGSQRKGKSVKREDSDAEEIETSSKKASSKKGAGFFTTIRKKLSPGKK